uniref:Uncharacterized protein n=1 Tax=Arundo donax TaxID=35708 RepID=A0A0A9A8X6_ARUDO
MSHQIPVSYFNVWLITNISRWHQSVSSNGDIGNNRQQADDFLAKGLRCVKFRAHVFCWYKSVC